MQAVNGTRENIYFLRVEGIPSVSKYCTDSQSEYADVVYYPGEYVCNFVEK